jgi:hypothetical protein
MRRLTLKQELFINHYLNGNTLKDSVIKSGYKVTSKESAAALGSTMINNKNIKNIISEKIKFIAENQLIDDVTPDIKFKTKSKRKSEQKLYERRLKNFNTTKEKIDLLRKNQNFSCAICKIKFLGLNFTIDHDHSCCNHSGSCGSCIRGLLCRNCNLSLGGFCDSSELLANAIKYLKGVL